MTPDTVSTGGIAALAGLAIGWTAKILVAFFQSKIWGGGEKTNKRDDSDCVKREECERIHKELDERLTERGIRFDKMDVKLDLLLSAMSDVKSAMSFLNGKLERKRQ
jgi:hypothetical protein